MSKPKSFIINDMFGFFKNLRKLSELQSFLLKQDLWNEDSPVVIYVCKLEKDKDKQADVGTLRHHLFVGKGFKFADINPCLEQFKHLSDEFLDAQQTSDSVL